MIGYKAFDKDLCCRGFQFEVGKTYRKDTKKEDMECCTDKVFHFCRELHAIEIESNYILSKSRICEVIAGDYVRFGDKYGTNEITILREITEEEKKELLTSGYGNSGKYNSGDKNSGDWNSGAWNSGDWNSGNRNSGNYNSGDWNSGSRNSGGCNSGSRNSGKYNSGDKNSGNFNSGDCNSGNLNSGNFNSGNYNSGNYNSGNYNSGNWNSGTGNSGYLNTDLPPVRMFNKYTDKKYNELSFPSFMYFNLTVWVSHDTATEEEKEQHKDEIKTCGGFLKTLEYKEAFRRAWNKADKEEHKKLLKLPNWNNEIFKEISGIDAEAEIAEENKD